MKVMQHSLMSFFASVFVVTMFMSCQAGQPKTEKIPAKQPPAAAPETAAASPETANSEANAQKKIIVYYFRGGARCPTCFKLENFAKSEIESSFADAIKSGALEFKAINVEEKGNEHFGDDYKLYTKSVIVSTVRDGKEQSWKNLNQIWQLVHDEGTYRSYIKREVKACLEGTCL